MGPAEQALLSLVGPSLEDLAGSSSWVDHGPNAIEPTTKTAVGDFRLDLKPLLGPETPTKSVCKEAAERLSRLNCIERAIGIPPRVYLRTSADFLYEHVISAIGEQQQAYGLGEVGVGQRAIVTFSDPNANKPLHLGHLRNNFIGMALAGLLEVQGYSVERQGTLSDWGIHICQAVLAYMKWGKGQTPKDAGVKGDHFLGKYYVLFHHENEKQKSPADSAEKFGLPKEARPTELEAEAAALLRRMQAGEDKLCRLNQMLTAWAESGIKQTYERIGTRLDKMFGEREMLSIAEKAIERALASGLCRRRADGSIYVDLGEKDLGEVTLVRGDGTPVVFTQMLGIDQPRFDRPFDKVLSIFGREWAIGAAGYIEVLRKFGYPWVSRYEPVYYGMVRLPEGRMKSREGKIVSADDLLDWVCIRLIDGWPGPAHYSSDISLKREICDRLGVALVKYHFLRTKRSDDTLYDEQTLWERSLPRFALMVRTIALGAGTLRPVENGRGFAPKKDDALRDLLLHLNGFARVLRRSLDAREPADLVRFLDELCRRFTRYRGRTTPAAELAEAVSIVLQRGLAALNIELPSSLELLPPPFTSPTSQDTSIEVGRR